MPEVIEMYVEQVPWGDTPRVWTADEFFEFEDAPRVYPDTTIVRAQDAERWEALVVERSRLLGFYSRFEEIREEKAARLAEIEQEMRALEVKNASV